MVKILFGIFRQISVTGNIFSRAVPAGHHFVDRFDLGKIFHIAGHIVDDFAIQLVTDADFDLFHRIQHVQLGDRHLVHTVDHTAVAGGDCVEPAAATGSAGGGTEFTADAAEFFAVGIKELGGERSFAYTGGVSLDYAPHGTDMFGSDPRTGTGSAGNGVAAGANIEKEEA